MDLETVPVVTCLLRHDAAILLLRRSDAVGSYSGRWGGVAGHVAPAPGADPAGHDPLDAARREIAEETGLDEGVELVRRGDPFAVIDAERGTRWVVHPFLFDCASRTVETDVETTELDWVSPPAILDRETVPDLDRSYAAVAPTVESVRDDETHGSAYVALRALEVLRDRAAGLTGEPSWATLVELAEELRDARPAMAGVRNRVNRAMAGACGHAREPVPSGVHARSVDAVLAATTAELDRALAATDQIAAVAGRRVTGEAVATLSRSGTVLASLRRGDPSGVLVGESRPGGEGAGVARRLAAGGAAGDGDDATEPPHIGLTTDAALPGLVAAGEGTGDPPAAAAALGEGQADEDPGGDGARWTVDRVLVGADGVTPDTVRNKVGTHGLAAAASAAGVPVEVACSAAKITTAHGGDGARGDGGDIAADAPAVEQVNPVFEATPLEHVDAVLTEDGVLEPEAVTGVARRHRALAGWPASAE